MTEAGRNKCLTTALACKSNQASEQRFVIPVANRDENHIGTLECVDRGIAADMKIVSDLTDWRRTYMRYFLTQFEATVSRTKSWLEDVVIPSPDRMLFVVRVTTGEAIGNFGICKMTASSGELDNLIRGRKGGDSQLIYYCELALLSWMFGCLGIRTSHLHVFSNNRATIKLHSSLGFAVLNSTQLTRRKLPGLTEYLLNSNEGDPVDFSYLEMGLNRDAFLDLHPWVRRVYADHWQSNSQRQQPQKS